MTTITIQSSQPEAVTVALQSAIEHEVQQLTAVLRRTEERLIALARGAGLDPQAILSEEELPDTLAEDIRLEIEGEREIRHRVRQRLRILSDIQIC